MNKISVPAVNSFTFHIWGQQQQQQQQRSMSNGLSLIIEENKIDEEKGNQRLKKILWGIILSTQYKDKKIFHEIFAIKY